MVVTPVAPNVIQPAQNADELKKLADDARNKTQQVAANIANSPITGGAQGQTVSAHAVGPSVRVDISNQARDAVKGKETNAQNTQHNKANQTTTQKVSIKA